MGLARGNGKQGLCLAARGLECQTKAFGLCPGLVGGQSLEWLLEVVQPAR